MGSRNPDTPQPPRPRGKKAAPLSTGTKARIGRGPLRRGTATLAPEELRFHTGRTGREGEDFSVHVRYEDILAFEADGPKGTLTVSTAEHGELVFHLGRVAVAWAEKLGERPDLLRDLGVSKVASVAVVGVQDERLDEALRGRVVEDAVVDVLFAGVEHRADLARLTALAERLKPGGVLWVVYPEGSRAVSEADITAAGRAAGLVDGATVEVSPGRSALRLGRTS